MRVFRNILISLVVSVLMLSMISNVFAQVRTPGIKVYNSPIDYQRATKKKITNYSEAPVLAELVKQGKLLPVEKRLPQNPIIIEPLEEIGQYGGTLRSFWRGTADTGCINGHIRYVRLVRFKADLKSLEPDLAEKYRVSRDCREFTFYIRKGVKWSDGQPFTADDVIFWYEDIVLNKELSPVFPSWLRVGNELPKIEKIDDYTFKIIFSAPNGLFLLTQAGSSGEALTRYPKHYLKQFHPKYTSIEELQKLMKKEGFDAWYKLFSQKADWLQNPDLPVLTAWKVTTPPLSTGRVVMERNPYFYKIDTAGNQLPYIDKAIWEMYGTKEVEMMKVISGEVDLHIRHFRAPDYPMLATNREKGKYSTPLYYEDRGGDDLVVYWINQTVEDPILRSIFRDKRFRMAFSLAINRKEINDLVYLGLGEPRQASMPSSSPYYDPEWEKVYTEYDPEKASKLLDEMGLTKRDKGGFRLRPDGKTLEITIEFAGGSMQPDALTLLKKYLEDIGIKVNLKFEDWSLYSVRAAGNEIQVGAWIAFLPKITNPSQLLATASDSPWAPLWGKWYLTNGEAGEEPPKPMKEVYRLWERIKSTPSDKERDRLFREICRIHKENLWIIGAVGETPRVGIIKENLRNIDRENKGKVPYDGLGPTPACTLYPEQFFMKR